jgi:hypothetical protein
MVQMGSAHGDRPMLCYTMDTKVERLMTYDLTYDAESTEEVKKE